MFLNSAQLLCVDKLVITPLQGSSMGQFFKQYLEPIKLNDVLVRMGISLFIVWVLVSEQSY